MIDKYYFESRFPKIELPYEKLLHNKVHTDLFFAIPLGEKVYIWFTYFKSKDICVLLTINKYNLIIDVEEIDIEFDRKLSRNTILFGTKFFYNKKIFVTIEDIFYYKGYEIRKENICYKKRLENIIILLDNDLDQKREQRTIFGLPLIFKNLKHLFQEINILKYNISIIKFVNYNDNNFKGFINYNKYNIEKITTFKIKADIKNDIYKLYCFDGYYGIALINNY